MITKRKKERLPELKDPGEEETEFCSPGSIEQALDMCESGSLRGDAILHEHGEDIEDYSNEEIGVDRKLGRFEIDMAEENREGDELSGDEHSAGLQGDWVHHYEEVEEEPLIIEPRKHKK